MAFKAVLQGIICLFTFFSYWANGVRAENELLLWRKIAYAIKGCCTATSVIGDRRLSACVYDHDVVKVCSEHNIARVRNLGNPPQCR